VTRIDAAVPGSALTLGLAEELARLAPFGLGNPGPTLLLPGAEIADLRTVGEGKHLRFRVSDHGRPSGSAIAFGFGGQLESLQRDTTFDLAFRLQENRWNGTVSPQLTIRRILEGDPAYGDLRARLLEEWARGEASWSPEGRTIFGELGLGSGEPTSLYESATFVALLAGHDLLARAA
jgi:single-stranded-DNA-specific exonuclease